MGVYKKTPMAGGAGSMSREVGKDARSQPAPAVLGIVHGTVPSSETEIEGFYLILWNASGFVR
ncbi:MAG: hypothetical protein DMG12_04265 [Acidobacteria bacterium]|nr:MAG: hypothetical protein DMG12_04265 [Acidobacteriota bacterium]